MTFLPKVSAYTFCLVSSSGIPCSVFTCRHFATLRTPPSAWSRSSSCGSCGTDTTNTQRWRRQSRGELLLGKGALEGLGKECTGTFHPCTSTTQVKEQTGTSSNSNNCACSIPKPLGSDGIGSFSFSSTSIRALAAAAASCWPSLEKRPIA